MGMSLYARARSHRVRNTANVSLVLAVFLLYDCIITLDREVRLFWTSKVNGASALFFMLKYGTVLYNVLSCVSFIPDMSNEVRHRC